MERNSSSVLDLAGTTKLSSRPERTRISHFALPATTTYAVFFKKTA